ncbi:uncharacterized protein SEPMUDRAFT_147110 [Sphaerulina musiva SO2202]|uniref:Uncharacterized protein n=1 Tax=Sphaerulina musiva (strain SO2202) TaxID=692275 RepID=M3DBB6_SPHMS|nr:uncharacterized protein SEPMUDRAFT_147110 [Sphaerulina musiva SO2202]EMF15144.1 hypothetical protein SEPMUDRAFT_147110 [Sphaerulina musiva SO2202]
MYLHRYRYSPNPVQVSRKKHKTVEYSRLSAPSGATRTSYLIALLYVNGMGSTLPTSYYM